MTGDQQPKPILYLFANAFPYGTYEPYLETEIKYLTNFEKIRIFSLSVRSEQLKIERQLDQPNVTVHPITFRSHFIYLIWALAVFFDQEFYKELAKILREKTFSWSRLVTLLVFLSRSRYESHQIAGMIRKSGDLDSDSPILLYSYRFAYQVHLASLVRKKISRGTIIARAHGSDLYEKQANGAYLPLRRYSIEAVEKLFVISQHGYDYITTWFPEYTSKIILSRLGTLDHGTKFCPHRPPFLLVTCSALVPLKRIDIVIEALELVSEHDIHWMHFGEGVLAEELSTLAAERLKDKANVSYEFMGFIANQDLLKFYQNQDVFLLLNVSSSEGIPVSIMEAQSFGIPCIATAVGGNPEIIEQEKNGRLLPVNLTSKDLAIELNYFFSMDDTDYQNFRSRSRKIWEEKFSSASNYLTFVEELRRLL